MNCRLVLALDVITGQPKPSIYLTLVPGDGPRCRKLATFPRTNQANVLSIFTPLAPPRALRQLLVRADAVCPNVLQGQRGLPCPACPCRASGRSNQHVQVSGTASGGRTLACRLVHVGHATVCSHASPDASTASLKTNIYSVFTFNLFAKK
jgi:hypothetical protein